MKDNPCGLKGFAFLEFSAPDKKKLESIFTAMGFHRKRHHLQHDIQHYQQGDICFLVNATTNTQANTHADTHGAGACAMGFLVDNAENAYQEAIRRGATAFHEETASHGLPAIQAIGGSVIYFVDEHHTPFQGEWSPSLPAPQHTSGLQTIDHLTHNVSRGHLDLWTNFYQNIFNFHQIRFFNIHGSQTGLISRALASPDGHIKIPLNESQDAHSQIEEFLSDYNGEGIQHIALSTNNIYTTVHHIRHAGISFLDVPDTYYEMIADRLPWHEEPIASLHAEKILIDGEKTPESGLLLQIFTENVFGPAFFEIIQRKGNDGFGEGNFQALFEAIERDQIRRGTL